VALVFFFAAPDLVFGDIRNWMSVLQCRISRLTACLGRHRVQIFAVGVCSLVTTDNCQLTTDNRQPTTEN